MEFPFVQFEFTHAIGPTEGRYVALPESAKPRLFDELDRGSVAVGGASPEPPAHWRTLSEHVADTQRVTGSADILVIALIGASVAQRRGLIVRRGPPVKGGEPPADVALQVVTVVRATRPFDRGRSANSWMDALRQDREEEDKFIDEALVLLNRAVRGYRIGSGDPYVVDVAREDVRAIRIGYGSGREVSEGRWDAAYLVLTPRSRQGRADRIRPSEIVAGVLNHRAPVFDSDELLLRAVLDLDQGRPRAAAFQLGATLELLPNEFAGQELRGTLPQRLARLQGRTTRVRELCQRSLYEPLGGEERSELLEIAEEAGTFLHSVRSHALSEDPGTIEADLQEDAE
ncbi:MAG TPA: hypothetical protein VHX88_16550 [Solirubrobacteraceae bacterium]|nr:hypothetical protein [Solirubrobacteraceae bacterium]